MGRFLFLSAMVCASCLDATQITVTITTSYPCGDTNTGILVGSEKVLTQVGTFTATRETCASANEVGALVVVPSGAPGEDVYLRVVAGVDGTKPDACTLATLPAGSHCIEARRILRFVQHRKLELPVQLDRSCINIRCGAKETCERGQCVNAIVTDPSCIADPAKCPDAATPSDSGVGPVTARLLAAGFDQACAVRSSDGALVCWGPNAPAVVTLPATLGPIAYVAIGAQHTCASDGVKVTCWGSNASGQTGGAQPVAIGATVTSIGALVAGERFTCALDTSTSPHFTKCWGALLDDTARPNERLVYQPGSPVTGDPGFAAIAAGARHVCGYVPSGAYSLFCWGDNMQRQCNAGSTQTSFLKPNPVTNLPTTVLGAGFDHSGAGGPTADMSGNRTFAWGTFGFQYVSVPDQIFFGEAPLCFREAATVRCASANNPMLTTLPFPESVQSAAAGRAFTCALGVSGRVYCLGTLAPLLMSAPPTEIVLP